MSTQTTAQLNRKYDHAELMRKAKSKEPMTFVLLDAMNPTAPIFMNIGGNRMRINKRPLWRPYREITFADSEGVNHTLRLKLNSNTLDRQEQIKNNIPANAKYTQAERDCVLFKHNYLVTDKPIVKEFLIRSPQFDGFEGDVYGITKSYTVFDEVAERKSTNSELKRRVKAAMIITNIEELEEAQELLVLLYGSMAPIAVDIEEAQNILADAINEDDELLAKVLEYEKKAPTADEATKVLVVKLTAAKILSFDQIDGKVGLKKGNSYIPVRSISSDIDQEKRVDLFVEFLNSEEGSPILKELKGYTEVKSSSRDRSGASSSKDNGGSKNSGGNKQGQGSKPKAKQNDKNQGGNTPAANTDDKNKAGVNTDEQGGEENSDGNEGGDNEKE